MRTILLFCSIVTTSAFSQWDVPVRLQLDGPSDAERQVVGVAAPITPDAAVSLEAARNLSTTFSYVTGSDILTGNLTPALDAYVAGMLVTIIPQETNGLGAQLALNNLPAVAIVRQDGTPVQSGDLPVGVPSRLAYDGVEMRLLSSALLKCPIGYTAGSNEFCIADSAKTAASFWTANARCANSGAQLCSVAEWMTACARIPGFMGTVPNAEWIDHAGNNITSAKVIGHGLEGIDNVSYGTGCTYGNWAVPSALQPHRCCIRR